MSEHDIEGGDAARLALVGRVGLGVSLLAAAVFTAVIGSLEGVGGDDYVHVVNSLATTRRDLLPALALGGCVLLALAGLLAWLVARWASFRLAGPLYRFARNVHGARVGAGEPMHIRNVDRLQAESRRLLDAIARVRAHEETLRAAARAAALALDTPASRDAPTDSASLRECLADLRATAERARV